MGDLQDEIFEFMKEIKLLQNRIWMAKMRNNQISAFSNAKFQDCEIMLEKCLSDLHEIRVLEAVEQRYDPS